MTVDEAAAVLRDLRIKAEKYESSLREAVGLVREDADEVRKRAEAFAAGERALLVLAPLAALFRKAEEEGECDAPSIYSVSRCGQCERIVRTGPGPMNKCKCGGDFQHLEDPRLYGMARAGLALVDGAMVSPPRKKGGLDAIFDQWPKDEPDADIPGDL